MRRLALSLIAALLLPAGAEARSAWVSGTFVYTDLCTVNDGGLAGRRVTVRRSPNGNGVTYEAAAGRLGQPSQADGLSIDDGTREIAFTVDVDGQSLNFRGVVSPDILSGTLTDDAGAHPLRLRRVLRQRHNEACRDEAPEPETTASH